MEPCCQGPKHGYTAFESRVFFASGLGGRACQSTSIGVLSSTFTAALSVTCEGFTHSRFSLPPAAVVGNCGIAVQERKLAKARPDGLDLVDQCLKRGTWSLIEIDMASDPASAQVQCSRAGFRPTPARCLHFDDFGFRVRSHYDVCASRTWSALGLGYDLLKPAMIVLQTDAGCSTGSSRTLWLRSDATTFVLCRHLARGHVC